MKGKDKWDHVVGKDVQPNEDGGAWITYWFDDDTFGGHAYIQIGLDY